MHNQEVLKIDRALEDLRRERRRLIDRIKSLIEASSAEAEIVGYLRGAENTSEAMVSLAKAYPTHEFSFAQS